MTDATNVTLADRETLAAILREFNYGSLADDVQHRPSRLRARDRDALLHVSRHRTATEAASKAEIAEQLDDQLNSGMVGVKRSLEWLEGYCAAATIARALLAKHQTEGRG